jgi:HTH-type transcriptional regulator/antitoxin HigA
MAQALHFGLGIPAESLLGPTPNAKAPVELDFSRFPIREIVKRGWLGPIDLNGKAKLQEAQDRLADIVKPLFPSLAPAGFFRLTRGLRSGRSPDPYALMAWSARVIEKSAALQEEGWSQRRECSASWISNLVSLSTLTNPLNELRRCLREQGILLAVEEHLSGTRIDGAALKTSNGWCVIGLSLRHDRLDNFWFTLLHELAHIFLHLEGAQDDEEPISSFFDDLDVDVGLPEVEREADAFAREALIPDRDWLSSPARLVASADAANRLAESLRIHPAIVAGRVRFEHRNYRLLRDLVGAGIPRAMFAAELLHSREAHHR